MKAYLDDDEPRGEPQDLRCGTTAGRVAHAKRGEPACEACRAARRETRRRKALAENPGYVPRGGTLAEKLQRYVRAEGECLVWTALHHDAGWGLVYIDGVSRVAHRVAYEQVHGPLGEGLILRHSCERRDCIRVEHLVVEHKRFDATEENARAVLLGRRNVDSNDCWNYTGGLNTYGYGLIGGTLTHRAAYEAWRGPIPDGLHIDHLCRNRRCFNPQHLEPVTPQENSRRGAEARTSCPNGHEWTPETTHINPRGARVCRACDRARRRSGGRTPAEATHG